MILKNLAPKWGHVSEKSQVPLTGGTPILVCAVPEHQVEAGLSQGLVAGASWGTDDTIVLGSFVSGLRSVSANGGELELVAAEDAGYGHSFPQFIPGRNAVLFTRWSGSPESAQVAVMSLETGVVRTLVHGTNPWFVPSGHIVFGRPGGSLWAVAFDVDQLEVVGRPVLVLENIYIGNRGGAPVAVAHQGNLVYTSGRTRRTLVWVGRQGREQALAMELGSYYIPRISPDGTRVAIDVLDAENRDIWIYDLRRQLLTRLTSHPAIDSYPALDA